MELNDDSAKCEHILDITQVVSLTTESDAKKKHAYLKQIYSCQQNLRFALDFHEWMKNDNFQIWSTFDWEIGEI